MKKKQEVKVFVYFDNKKYSMKEKNIDIIQLFMMLKEMETEYKYKNCEISNEQYKSQIEKCEFVIDGLESLRKKW